SIFFLCNMENAIEHLKKLLSQNLPRSDVKIDEPNRDGGNYWVDVRLDKKRHTLEYRPGKGFGLFHEDAGFGEGPAEIYRTPERAVLRLEQLMASGTPKANRLSLKELRELYGQSQVKLAKK